MTEHWHSSPTQVYWTCKALVEGRFITHWDEIGEVRGWRLGAIIHNLRTKYHWPIVPDYRGLENIAHYRLVGRPAWQSLDFPRSAKMLRAEIRDAAVEARSGAPEAFAAFCGVSDGKE